MAVFTCSDKINQALIQKGQSYNVNPIQKEADQGAAATTINLCPPLKAKTEEIVLSTTNIAVLLKRMLINDADAVKDLLSNKSFWDCIDKREAKNFELNQLFTNHEQLLMGLNTEEQKHKENLSLPSDLFELIEDLDVISVEEFYPNATESS